MKPPLVVLAGPNGAGKSTFYRLYLEGSGVPFLNADVLQANTGLPPYEAARAVDQAREVFLQLGTGFITETVFSDPDGRKLQFLRDAIAAGFDVQLIFIGLASPELSRLRVEQRVANGGHDVPRDKLISRYPRTLENLERALTFVPTVRLYDNSQLAQYKLLGFHRDGQWTESCDQPVPDWARRFIQA